MAYSIIELKKSYQWLFSEIMLKDTEIPSKFLSK